MPLQFLYGLWEFGVTAEKVKEGKDNGLGAEMVVKWRKINLFSI
jgi:hypothetical protein